MEVKHDRRNFVDTIPDCSSIEYKQTSNSFTLWGTMVSELIKETGTKHLARMGIE